MTAPDRIWAWTSGQAAGIFDTSFHDNVGSATEYIRADLAAVQPAQVLETCGKCRGSGYGGHPDSGQLCADCNGSGGVEPQPDPRDEVIKGLVEALEFYADEDTYETQHERMPCDCCTDIFEPINDDKGSKARAAIAAAKAVQHG